MTHVHADHAPHRAGAGAVHHRRHFAVSLLGASALARLAIVAAVSVFLWLTILWALA